MTRKTFTPIPIKLLAVVLLLSVLTGCVSKKDCVVYMKNADQVLTDLNLPAYQLSIKPGDELRVSISSVVPEATAMYNVRQIPYIVTPQGYITIPALGDIQVEGKTTHEVKGMIYDLVSKNVKDPVVSVEFANYRITVLGEVMSPHIVTVNVQRFSVLDALGACGGLRLTGLKDCVRLLREEDGKVVSKVLDLSDANIVNSPYYYMQQNDVLIVDANDAVKANAQYNQMNGFRLSVFSTTISAISVIVSLFIALSK